MKEFTSHRLPQREGNMNSWLIEDGEEPLEHEVSNKGVDSNLESTASSKPMWKKTTKVDPDRASRNIYEGKEEDVGLDELGEGGKGVVSKIGEFGEDIDSELLGERGGEVLFGGGEGGEGGRL
ncbi:hypothetical protein Tco_1358964 [Tanacetum coccineum]